MLRFELQIGDVAYRARMDNPIDLSIPLRSGDENPNCFHAPEPEFSPLTAGDFIGSTREGSPVNFYNVRFNPHGNGTHTECVGHISKEGESINGSLREFHFAAELMSVEPAAVGDDLVVGALPRPLNTGVSALILRTLPQRTDNGVRNYSGSNPPYLSAKLLSRLREAGIDHLLLDLPSLDREEDGGKLAGHKAFWDFEGSVRKQATITEMIRVPSEAEDGLYLLNLQIAPFELDASPSKPVIYALDRQE